MPLFIDVHNIEGGVSASDAAGAHRADLATQGAFGVSYLRYLLDEEAGKIFCLVRTSRPVSPGRAGSRSWPG